MIRLPHAILYMSEVADDTEVVLVDARTVFDSLVFLALLEAQYTGMRDTPRPEHAEKYIWIGIDGNTEILWGNFTMKSINNLRKSMPIPILYALIIFISVISNNPVLADINVDETENIEINGDYVFQLNGLKSGDVLTAEFEITSGDAVDLFLVDAANYNRYQNKVIIDVVSDENGDKVYAQNVKSSKLSLVIGEAGDYYLIVENDERYGLANPTGPVTIHAIILIDTDDDTSTSIQTSTPTENPTMTETPSNQFTPVQAVESTDSVLSPEDTIEGTATPGSDSKTPGFGFLGAIVALCLVFALRRK